MPNRKASLIEIANPGNDHCGYYAFALGLIDIIQKEYAASTSNRSPMFETWSSQLPLEVTLHQLVNFDLSYPAPPILDLLQINLRRLSANALLKDLNEKIDQEAAAQAKEPSESVSFIEGAVLYIKFAELVMTFQQFTGMTSNELEQQQILRELKEYNELAECDRIITMAKSACHLIWKDNNPSDTFQEALVRQSLVIKQVILKDMGAEFPLLIQAINTSVHSKRWASHMDLSRIAEILKVNLKVDGIETGHSDPSIKTITLANRSSSHWTTLIEPSEVKLLKVTNSPHLFSKTFIVSRVEALISDAAKRLMAEGVFNLDDLTQMPTLQYMHQINKPACLSLLSERLFNVTELFDIPLPILGFLLDCPILIEAMKSQTINITELKECSLQAIRSLQESLESGGIRCIRNK